MTYQVPQESRVRESTLRCGPPQRARMREKCPCVCVFAHTEGLADDPPCGSGGTQQHRLSQGGRH